MLSKLTPVYCLFLSLTSIYYMAATEGSPKVYRSYPSNFLTVEGNHKIEEIENPTPDVVNQYTDLFRKILRESLASCKLFTTPLPRRFSLQEITGTRSDRVIPSFVVLHRCDEACRLRPSVEEVNYVVKVQNVINRTKKYYRMTFENHTSCI